MSDHEHLSVTEAIAAIDDLLFHRLPQPEQWPHALDGTVHIHTTDDGDVHGEWLVVVEGDRVVVTREHAKGSCALRGSAADIHEVLWRRRPLSSLDVVGDVAVAERFVALAVLD